MGRDTVSKRLTQYGVEPCGSRNGHPVYRLRDASLALLSIQGIDENGHPDPSNLPPVARNAWYQSEIRRLDFEMSSGRLIPALQYEAALSDMAKDLVRFLETLPDLLERDLDLTPEQVQRMHDEIDRHRQSLYEQIVQTSDAVQPAKAEEVSAYE